MGHANARTTPKSRRLMVDRIRVYGWSVTAAADSAGVSRRCAYKWLDRWDTEGEAGLLDRSSRPNTMPARTPVRVEVAVLAARRMFRRGPDWLAAQLDVPARTVSRILARHSMPYLWELDLVTGEPVRVSHRRTHLRYERDQPGDLVHMDTKKIAVIPDGGGSRLLGRQGYRTETRKQARPGYEYIHSVVDDHSRFAYSEVLPREDAEACAGFFERAIAVFAAHGITIREVMTDNAWAYINSHRFAGICARIGARHITIKPHCPWQNGKVERYNRILKEEWVYAMLWADSQSRTATLEGWLHEYNHHRPHGALGYKPPISRL